MTRTQTFLRAAIVAVSLAAAILPVSAESQTTVFLVRHAEKNAEGTDPGLSAAGIERADVLAGMLADVKVNAIFSSEYKRARETAAPLGKRLSLPVTVVPANDADGLLTKVRALAPGSRALIVGHSNTVPALGERLTGKRVDLAESDYDRLYVATIRAEGEGELVVLHYGEVVKPAPAR